MEQNRQTSYPEGSAPPDRTSPLNTSENKTNSPPLTGEDADRFYKSQIDRTHLVKNFKVSIDEQKSVRDQAVRFANLHKPKVNGQQVIKTGEGGTAVKKKKKIANPKALVLCVVLIISIASSLYLLSCINDVLALTGSDTKTSVTIPENASQMDILQILQDNGLIHHPHFCNFFVNTIYNLRNRGTGKKAKDIKYLNGIYQLNKKMGVEGMLNAIKDAPKTVETKKLTFPEGWTVDQTVERLEKYGICDRKAFYENMQTVNFNEYSFIKSLPDANQRFRKLEGYLYPDTYEFYVEENETHAIRRFLDNFQEKFNSKYEARAKELGMTVDEIVTIASVIQKEAANKEQMGLISSVIHNRLKKSMKLECDSTGAYVDRYIKPNVSDGEYLAYRNRYYTYLCSGLPAGPICNPGADAIEAALYPEKTNYLYFYHDKNGKIYMAKTLEEHNANQIKALQNS